MEKKTSSMGALDCLVNTVRKQLHAKKSTNHAFNPLKGHSPTTSAEPASPLREYTFYTDSISTPTTSCAQGGPRYRISTTYPFHRLPASQIMIDWTGDGS